MNTICSNVKSVFINETEFNTIISLLQNNISFEKLQSISYKIYPYLKKHDDSPDKLYIII